MTQIIGRHIPPTSQAYEGVTMEPLKIKCLENKTGADGSIYGKFVIEPLGRNDVFTVQVFQGLLKLIEIVQELSIFLGHVFRLE